MQRRDGSSEGLLVWRFYWVHGIFTSNAYRAKWEGALGRISAWGDDAANIAIATSLPEGAAALGDAQSILQNYLDTQGHALSVSLAATRGYP